MVGIKWRLMYNTDIPWVITRLQNDYPGNNSMFGNHFKNFLSNLKCLHRNKWILSAHELHYLFDYHHTSYNITHFIFRCTKCNYYYKELKYLLNKVLI